MAARGIAISTSSEVVNKIVMTYMYLYFKSKLINLYSLIYIHSSNIESITYSLLSVLIQIDKISRTGGSILNLNFSLDWLWQCLLSHVTFLNNRNIHLV